MASYLFETLTGFGDPDDSDVIDYPGGPGCFACQGTFDGATFQLRWSIDGGTTYTDMSGAEMTIVKATTGGTWGIFSCRPASFVCAGQAATATPAWGAGGAVVARLYSDPTTLPLT